MDQHPNRPFSKRKRVRSALDWICLLVKFISCICTPLENLLIARPARSQTKTPCGGRCSTRISVSLTHYTFLKKLLHNAPSQASCSPNPHATNTVAVRLMEDARRSSIEGTGDLPATHFQLAKRSAHTQIRKMSLTNRLTSTAQQDPSCPINPVRGS